MSDRDIAIIDRNKNTSDDTLRITYTQDSDIMEITLFEKTQPRNIIKYHKIHQPNAYDLHQYLNSIGITEKYQIRFCLQHSSLIHKTCIHIHSDTPNIVTIDYNDIRQVCSLYEEYSRYIQRFDQQDIIVDSTTTFKQMIAQNAIIYHQHYPFLQNNPQTQYTYATVVHKHHLNPRVYIRIIARPHPNTPNHIRVDLEIYIDQYRRHSVKYIIHHVDNPDIPDHQRRHQHFQRIHALLQRAQNNLPRIPHGSMSQHAIIELHRIIKESLSHNKNTIIHDAEYCCQAILDHYPPIARTPN